MGALLLLDCQYLLATLFDVHEFPVASVGAIRDCSTGHNIQGNDA